jgi:hypothetical protein
MGEQTSSIWGTEGQEQGGYQRQAARLLLELLERAGEKELPVIQWTVGAGGARLTGQIRAHDEAEGRRQFEAWAAQIGAQLEPEFTSLGQTRLRAFVKNFEGGLASVGIVAELDEPEEEA